MDSEEKELLKQILTKVNKLEEKIKEKDRAIEKLKEKVEERKEKDIPKIPEIPQTNDRLFNAIRRAGRQRALREASRKSTFSVSEGKKVGVKDIRDNFSLGEIISFVFKKKIPIGNLEEEEESKSVIIED